MSESFAHHEPPTTSASPEVDQSGPAPVESSVEWRRVHKITPVLNVWKLLALFIGFGLFQNFQILTEVWDERDSVDWGLVALIGGGILALLALLVLGYSALAWYRMRYAIGRDAVYLHSGIVFRQQRHARLNRIQTVDIVRPLLGRIFGLSRLRVETAGGSAVDLAYLRDDEVHRLRREVLARIQESRQEGAATPAGPSPTPSKDTGTDRQATTVPPNVDSTETPVHTVPTDRLFASLVRSGALILFLVLMTSLVAGALLTQSVAALIPAAPGLLAWGAMLWSQFNLGFNFRSAVSVDGIRLRHGLLEQRTQTLPPGRVHAVGLKQPWLWRRKGWWRVNANVAGHGGGDANELVSANVLLPVGERGEALTALWLVLPELGVGDARGVIDAALEGVGSDSGFLASPPSARWLDPIGWRRNGLLITERGIIIRGGRLSRWASFVPHERIQSLKVARGPLQRALRLTSFEVAGVDGRVLLRAHHLEPGAVLESLETAATHALRRRHQESTTQWLQRMELLATSAMTEPAGPQPPPAAPGNRAQWPPPTPHDA